MLGGWALRAQAGNPGAKFVAYISPQNQTKSNVTQWVIHLKQRGGSWEGTITSGGSMTLQTPGLSGVFDVKVIASGPNFSQKQLSPASWSRADVGCNSNCTAMIGIVATPDGKDAHYWTVWDAVCN
jgi:hypothetical protein